MYEVKIDPDKQTIAYTMPIEEYTGVREEGVLYLGKGILTITHVLPTPDSPKSHYRAFVEGTEMTDTNTPKPLDMSRRGWCSPPPTEKCHVCNTNDMLVVRVRVNWLKGPNPMWVRCDRCGNASTPKVNECPHDVWNLEQKQKASEE